MVLINDKKYACATCIKGHRVSGCSHTDRPLFEVKKKGRPTTQCVHCRDKRKNGASNGSIVHTKCVCGEAAAPSVIMPGQIPSVGTSTPDTDSADVQTKKGQPGSKATFPNGLKDVHEMAAAAEALNDLNSEEVLKAAERKVANLLNPCKCYSGGKCRCCQPRRDRADSVRDSSPTSSGAITPTHGHVTDSLIEMFKSKATTSTTESSCCSSKPKPTISTNDIHPPSHISPQLLSPDFMHHPAHTSVHVHKTRLYSPYTTPGHMTPRNGFKRDGASPGPMRGGWASSSTAEPTPPPTIRPLSDMNRFLGAVFKEDGSVADSIPRSALGLPGIQSFVDMAEEGSMKPESTEMVVDSTLQFPTYEDVVIGACTCGDDCVCPSCATHGNAPANGVEPSDSCCGEGCKSSFNCSDHLSLPKGITSIDHLLSFAAANVPHPAQKRSHDLFAHANDTRVLPPAALLNEEAARSHGIVALKPLECCNGRCQCPPGKCTCGGECCGCCMHCNCDDGDGDTKMHEDGAQKSGGCCSTSALVTDNLAPSPSSSTQSSRRPSIVHGSTSPRPASESGNISPSIGVDGSNEAADTRRPSSSQSTLAPAAGVTRQSSPRPPASSSAGLRRTSSTSTHPKPAGSSRRSTVSRGTEVQRSASTGKSASKALALHSTPNHPHPHPRAILPKPAQSQGTAKSCCGPRNNAAASDTPPNGQTSAALTASSSQTQDQPQSFAPGSDQISTISIPSMPAIPTAGFDNQPPESSDNLLGAMTDEDIMAMINQYASQGDAGMSIDQSIGASDPDQAFQPNGSFGADSTMDSNDLFASFMASLGAEQSSTPVPPQTQTEQQPPPTADPLNPERPSLAAGLYGLTINIDNNATQPQPEPVFQQLPLQSTAFLQQILAGNPSFTASGQQQREAEDTSSKPGSTPNPDVIDLSKPLNASDVERILRALQQQARSPKQASAQSTDATFSAQAAPAPSSGPSGDTIVTVNGFPVPTEYEGYSSSHEMFHGLTFDQSAMMRAQSQPQNEFTLAPSSRAGPEHQQRLFFSVFERGTGL